MDETRPKDARVRAAAWLAVIGLPLTLVNGLGGILGLVAVAMASPQLRRRPDDRRAFATVVLGFGCMLIGGCIGSAMLIGPGIAPRPDVTGAPQPGSWTDLDGRPVSLASGDGRPTIVDVWATWCGPCIQAIPTLEAIHRDLADEVRVISIAVESERVVRPWIEARQAAVDSGELPANVVPSYPIITIDDGSPDLARATRAYPTLWILAPDGTVVQEFVGMHDLITILAAVRFATDPPAGPDDASVSDLQPSNEASMP